MNPPYQSNGASPFDDSAHARQIRMGLLNDLGVPEQDAVAVLCRVYAALFYDALCDNFSDMEQVFCFCRELEEVQQQESDSHTVFLAICSGYDNMLIPVPEALWWISKNPDLESAFVEGFMRRLICFCDDGVRLCDDGSLRECGSEDEKTDMAETPC